MYVPGPKPEDLVEKVMKDFPGLGITLDKQLAFYSYLTPLIESGKQLCTVRFTPGTIRIPALPYGMLPWIETDPDDETYRREIGIIRIPLVIVAEARSFPRGLALLDNYSSKREMIEDIQSIYNCTLKPDGVLSAYFIGEFERKE